MHRTGPRALASASRPARAAAAKQYKNGKRDNPIMKPMVAALSDVDIANLAAHYAQLGCK